jgi:hypothetical protein
VLLLRDSFAEAASEERGWIRALTESHIPFDEASVDDFIEDSLARYKAVVLPTRSI